jgi:predicted ribosome quality control (RQC) complex YloA/Tae2 family protein
MENLEKNIETNLIEMISGILKLRKKIADLEKENEKLKDDYDIICRYASNIKNDLNKISPENLV